ncbi:MAG: chemotaxis protein CheA [Firmicutes bacterium]|nr:chemotaxis protein CheA [Bacillota bacterium]
MGFQISADDLKVFLDEADEQLQLLEEDIVKLEQLGEDDELLQEIFRAAHTLKGSSATLGHQRMAELTHSMENVLDKLRKHKLEVNSDIVDTLFKCLDALRSLKEEIATGETQEVDLGALVMKLRVVGAEEPGGERAGQAAPGGTGELDWETRQRLAEAHEKGQPASRVFLQIEPASPMPSVRAFQALLKLGEIGEVIWSRPNQREIEDEQVGTSLETIALGLPEWEELARALGEVPEVRLERVADVQAAAEPGSGSPSVGEKAPTPAGHQGPPAEKVESAARGSLRKGSRTVRVDVEVLDNLMNLIGELVIDRTRLTQLVGLLEGDQATGAIGEEMGRTSSHIGRVSADLQEQIMRARMLPVETLFKKFPRMVRDLAQAEKKEIDFVIRGEETELDRSVIEEIGDPLMHLLRNAVDHGVEEPAKRLAAGKPARGVVLLEASHEENSIIITVRDDGGGIDPQKVYSKAVEKGLVSAENNQHLDEGEILNFIFAPGFSTAEQVSEVSGRGVGMDVVHRNIEKLNGSIETRTEVGRGTEFRIKLPLTLAIIRALLVELAGRVYAMPLTSVLEAIHISAADVKTIKTHEVIVVRNRVIPLVRLDKAFLLEEREAPAESFPVVLVGLGARHFGVAVDRLVGEQEVVIKSLGKYIGEVPGISGATILGDGSVSLILDMASLISLLELEARTA